MAKGPPFPAWAEAIRRKYLSGEASVFILHLNVFDEILYDDTYYSLTEFLTRVMLWDNKSNILVYDPAAGLSFIKEKDKAATGKKPLPNRSPSDVLPALEDVLFNTDSTALIVPYAGTIVPAGTMTMLGEQDRINVVTMHRWSLSDQMNVKDNVAFLITESLAEIHASLVSNPKVAAVTIPMPNLEERQAVIQKSDPSIDAKWVAIFAKHTAGLKAVQLAALLTPVRASTMDDEARRDFILSILGESRDAEQRADKLSALTRAMSKDEIRHLINPEAKVQEQEEGAYTEVLELVAKRKREIIEKECHGLIEFINAKHDFTAVGGNEAIKEELLQIAENVRSGDKKRVPMGLLFVGPMGSGKTFVASAFSNASGLPAVKLKNFRSKWVGSTEANLEKVLSMVQALGPIILIIDEGDRAFGNTGDGDGGTGSRVIGRIKEFMSDPENRGQVLFILMTNRPDKLDVDIKRAGRLDRKIPFFYAYNTDDIESVLTALFNRHSIETEIDWEVDRASTTERLLGYSNADLEAVVLLANDMAAMADQKSVDVATFGEAITDYMPSRDTNMLEYMELLAVFEASRRSMLPEKYRDLSADELSRKLTEKRALIGI